MLPKVRVREAIETMKVCETAEEMAECFERIAKEIEREFPGWRFVKLRGTDGSYIFQGQIKGQLLVVSAEGVIYKKTDAPEAIRLQFTPQGALFEVDYSKLDEIFRRAL